jgi:DNA-binding response OmpR family regulator
MKILLVEDEIEIANFLIQCLKHEGYTVEHVDNGKDAVKAILDGDFDVVLLDLLLPQMSGEEVLKKVRDKQNTAPIIVLTVIQDGDSKINLLNLGADDYIVKPFSFEELAGRIKSVFRRTNQKDDESEEMTIGDLKIVPSMRAAYRGGKLIKLRMKEYELLQYLMRNPNQVISNNTLIEKVWDYNARIFSNTVGSHISLLRKKIDKGAKKKMIETVHGVGYMLRSED